MPKILFAFLLIIAAAAAMGQSPVKYGSNPAAGKYYMVRGIKMYVEQYGQGKPLLMVHGNGGSIESMSKIIPFFSKRYHVIATDSRAHGKSIDPSDSLSFEMMADDEAALLDQMHIDSAYVIGWSDGGIVAIVLAMRHPGKVIKLASTGANLWPDSTALIPSAWKDEKQYYDANVAKPRTTVEEKNTWKIFMLDWLQPNIPLSALSAIKCPSLIISGDHDLIVLEHTIAIYRSIAKAYLWVLPNSTHGTLIDHTDDFDHKVNEFFEKPFQQR